jgi:hypothetical protein
MWGTTTLPNWAWSGRVLNTIQRRRLECIACFPYIYQATTKERDRQSKEGWLKEMPQPWSCVQVEACAPWLMLYSYWFDTAWCICFQVHLWKNKKNLATISKGKGLTIAINWACMLKVSILFDNGSLSKNSVGLKANKKLWVRWLMSMFQKDNPQTTMTWLTHCHKYPHF